MGFSLGSALPAIGTAVGAYFGGPTGAMIGAQVGSSLGGSMSANSASDAQMQAQQNALAAQQSMYDQTKQRLDPFVQAGYLSLDQQKDYLGLNGPQRQQAFIDSVKNSPEFGTMLKQMQDQVLQNASATGGLRGGNTQGALMQLSPQILMQLLAQKYSAFGGLSSSGQNAAAGLGSIGANTANQMQGIYQNMGNVNSNNIMAQNKSGQKLGAGLFDYFKDNPLTGSSGGVGDTSKMSFGSTPPNSISSY